MMNRQDVLTLVVAERVRQAEKWGEPDHTPLEWLALMQEELGEAAKAWFGSDRTAFTTETVQLAALAVACLEQFCGVAPLAKGE